MGTSIPGFQTVKNNVIKPLIVATEKVVEYYFAADTSSQPEHASIVDGSQDMQAVGDSQTTEQPVTTSTNTAAMEQ